MRAAVYGLGNVLMGDDALGPYVVEVLKATYDLSPEVTVGDLGTPGLDLAPYMAGLDALVLVDAVIASGEPGDVLTYRLPDILHAPTPPRLSPHGVAVTESLLLASLVGEVPGEVLLVGVIPGATAPGVGLSRPVWQAVPRAMAAVVSELRRLGLEVAVRDTLAQPHIWWEEAAPTKV